MCGICGYFGNLGSSGASVLERMNTRLFRRGPDDGGSFVDDHAGIAMRRLSIQDVSGGHQPIFNEDRSIAVVFNGEIYNHIELRNELLARGHHFQTRSDTEVLVHLYEEYSETMLTRLRGMFAFAIYDLKKKTLLLARDRLGIKPLFYARHNGITYFASEIKALREALPTISNLDVQALDAYFAYGYIPAPLTIFKEVRKLEPGHAMMLTGDGKARGWKYWDVSFSKANLSESAWIEKADAAIQSAVSSHLISDVPVGAFLSGGVDSGLVGALAAPALDYPLETFTIGFEGRAQPLLDERQYAKDLADRYGFVYREYAVRPDFESIATDVLDAFDEPFADDSVIPSYYVSKLAAESVKVVLSGLGGDELFGGYQRYIGYDLSRRYQAMPSFLHRLLIDPVLQRLPEPRSGGDRVDHLKRFSASALLPPARRYAGYVTALGVDERRALYGPALASMIDFDATEALMTDHFDRCDSSDEMDRVFYTDFKTYLPEDILALSDRISMWHSLEVRVPLIDHQLVELAATMPSTLKIKGGQGKVLLKRLAEKYLPSPMIYHRKQGFEAPMGAWLRNELYDYAKQTFADTESSGSLIRGDFLREKLQEHKLGVRKNNKLLFSSIMFLLWSKRFGWSL
ncbi:MAG: asparagine synthase (glutamine-hydrolyzing) [Chromatiales bacterium]|jgi:asparagine synthase (glutamine-hydrolysing)|nr:asparagine synthase (glutamine-hydrolyzing) [Chromatiales bacterium]